MGFNWPLMEDNVTREDLDALIEFLKGNPRLTQSANVRKFEEEWSRWLGVRHSVFVNSGASANLVTMAALKHMYGGGEVIVPALTWVSDISSVLVNGFTPVFVDADQRTLGMDEEQVLERITDKTRAIFLTYVLGFNCLSDRLLDECKRRGIHLIEDVCESHGTTFKSGRLGSFGTASNFSFYFAHHMSTIEGGMVCTNDDELYDVVRMLRSHGMTREAADPAVSEKYQRDYPDLSPDFTFALPGFNVRSTELNAVIGLNQLKRLDANNELRRRNLAVFLEHLDSRKYFTDFETEGNCNYAFVIILRDANDKLRDSLERTMREGGIEFRRGTAGGGNQLRQPYLRGIVADDEYKRCPVVDHIHFYGYYVGNYPGLAPERVIELCELLNSVEA